MPPASEFTCLGVRIDLGWVHTAGFIIKNKTERILQITQNLKEIIQKQTVSAAQASVLKGRMSFSNSQTYSRVGVVGFKCLEKRSNHATVGRLKEDECRAITWWTDAITQLPPRSIHHFWKCEATGQSRSWFSRAPSVSNIGDAPSRKDTEEIAKLYPGTIWRQWTRADEIGDVNAWGAL